MGLLAQKNSKYIRRGIITVLILVFVLTGLSSLHSFGYDPNESGIIEAGKNKDIYINVDPTMLATLSDTAGKNLTADDLVSDLRAYLTSNYPDAYNDANIRVRSNIATIDTTNLENWYVFDHYDDGKGTYSTYVTAATNTAKAYNGTEEYFTGMRPYYQTRETRSYVSSTQAFSEVYSIKELLELGPAVGMKEIGSLIGSASGTRHNNVRKLKEHIYSFSDDNGAHMIFMGYGANARTGTSGAGGYNYLTDFLFYPANSPDEKTIEFDVNAEDVRTHSMEGAGFLLNAGIDENGNIHGYVLYISFSPAGSDYTPTSAQMHLYKIGNDKYPTVSANLFHDRNGANSTATAKEYMTLIGSTSVQTGENIFLDNSQSFRSKMHLKIVFDDNGLSVKVADVKAGTEVEYEESDYLAASFSALPANFKTGYYGFGPLVDYTGSGHTCSTTSVYKFTNLEMYFKVDVFGALMNTQFHTSQNTDRFFVNLVSVPIDESNDDFWEGIARLRTDKIYYISNGQNSVIGDSGVNKNNGLNTSSSTYEDLIAEIAEYINSGRTWDDELDEMDSPIPYASFDIVGTDKQNETPVPVDRVEQKMLASPDYKVQIKVSDKSMVSSPGVIKQLRISWTYPDESEHTRVFDITGDTNLYDLFVLGTDVDDVGTYTVSVVAITETEESFASTRTFEVIKDETKPVAEIASDTSLIVGGVYEGNDITLSLTDVGWGVKAYQIGYGTSADSASYLDEVVLDHLWEKYTLSISDLGAGNRTLYIRVWDWVGNQETYSFKINPRVLSVTMSKENRYGLDLSSFDFSGFLTAKYITGETVFMPNVDSLFPMINGEFKLLGFYTDKASSSPLSTLTMAKNTTLYPVIKDVVTPQIAIHNDDVSNIVSGVYEGNSIRLLLTDGGTGVKSYQYGYGTTADTAAYTEKTTLDTAMSSSSFEIPEIGSGRRKLFVRAWDSEGNIASFELSVNPRIHTIMVSRENHYGLDLSSIAFANFTGKYIYGETEIMPGVSGVPLVNGFELVGFHTDKAATTALDSLTVTGDMTLYPVYKDVTKPNLSLVSSGTGFIEKIEIDVSVSDNHLVDKVHYYIKEYAKGDMIPSSFTDSQIESLVDTNWIELSGSNIFTSDSALTSGKRYVVFVKATDPSGNISYEESREYIYDSTAPVVSVGGTTISELLNHSLSTKVSFSDNYSDFSQLQISYTKNGGNSVVVTSNGLLLSPPNSSGQTDTYIFTVFDGAGNRTVRTIVLDSTLSDSSWLDDISSGNVSTDKKSPLESLKDVFEDILERERAVDSGDGNSTGALESEIAKLENAVSKIESLLDYLISVEEALDDFSDLKDSAGNPMLHEVSSGDRVSLESILEDLLDMKDSFYNNLTPSEAAALDDLIQVVSDSIEKIKADERLSLIESGGLSLTDKEPLEDLLGLYEELLTRPTLTKDEADDIGDKLTDVKDKLESISRVEEFIDNFEDLIELPVEDLTAKEYSDAISAYEGWNGLTEIEKALVSGAGNVSEKDVHIEKLYFKATADGRKETELSTCESKQGTVCIDIDKLYGSVHFSPNDLLHVESGGGSLFRLIVESKGLKLEDHELTLLYHSLDKDRTLVHEVVDISLWKILVDRYGDTLSEDYLSSLMSPLRIVIPLSEEQQGLDVRLYRIHDGITTYMPDLDTDTGTYTIETDQFSTYVFIYNMADVPVDAPQTGQNVSPVSFILLFLLSLLTLSFTAVHFQKKRNI